MSNKNPSKGCTICDSKTHGTKAHEAAIAAEWKISKEAKDMVELTAKAMNSTPGKILNQIIVERLGSV